MSGAFDGAAKPIQKTHTVEVSYWSCGLDADGHWHITEAGAADCMARQRRPARISVEWTDDLLCALAEQHANGASLSDLAAPLGIGKERLRQVLAKHSRRTRTASKSRLQDNPEE
jgi:hypothetical protein